MKYQWEKAVMEGHREFRQAKDRLPGEGNRREGFRKNLPGREEPRVKSGVPRRGRPALETQE